MNRNFILTLALYVITSLSVTAQVLKSEAQAAINQLEEVVKQAKGRNICTLKEDITLRTAEIFMTYADYDDKNKALNEGMLAKSSLFKDDVKGYAEYLPKYQREEIIIMVNEAKAELQRVLSGQIKRLYAPKVNWAEVTVDKDQLLYKGQPVFLADWTWKDSSDPLTTEYHGNQDGYLLNPNQVTSEEGDLNSWKHKELSAKESGEVGFIFLQHSTDLAKWAKDKYPEIMEGGGLEYVKYDINHPVATQILKDLFEGYVPYMKDQNYSAMGYMLCNEPHWNLQGSWTSSPISDYAKEDFKAWAEETHGTIERANSLWKTSYSSFKTINVPELVTADMQGTPFYFDMLSWNMHRVTYWFTFLRDEIQKYHPDALTHIKIMPTYITGNGRYAGIDMEALTHLSGIIGNDAGTIRKQHWGTVGEWFQKYCVDWRELCLYYDFCKSVSPEKFILNSEGHLFDKVNDFRIPVKYVRWGYWVSQIQGLAYIQTWYWPRKVDGSVADNLKYDGDFIGSCSYQPRVINEVHTTTTDLCSISNQVVAFQRAEKPIRIFYSKASAINGAKHMDDIYSAYENLFFDGAAIGFVTEGIIDNQDNSLWDVVVIHKSPQMYAGDAEALQNYLDQGGTILIDDESMLENEYHESLNKLVDNGKGQIIKYSTMDEMRELAYQIIEKRGNSPLFALSDNNGLSQKGCWWRTVKAPDGNKYISLANFSRNNTQVKITNRNGTAVKSVINTLTGQNVGNTINMEPFDVMMVTVE